MKYDDNGSGNFDELDIMQKRVMDRLDQNHRILRYLHNWADNFPDVLKTQIPNHLIEFNKQNNLYSNQSSASSFSIFGLSMIHILLILMLTLCILFWDSNMNQDINIFNAGIEFLTDLYVIFHGYIPPSLQPYENIIAEFAQNTVNQTTLLTQNLLNSIK